MFPEFHNSRGKSQRQILHPPPSKSSPLRAPSPQLSRQAESVRRAAQHRHFQEPRNGLGSPHETNSRRPPRPDHDLPSPSRRPEPHPFPPASIPAQSESRSPLC